MTSVQYDVLGIGNAIVDVIAQTEEDFLVKHGMQKGAMTLIEIVLPGSTLHDADTSSITSRLTAAPVEVVAGTVNPP